MDESAKLNLNALSELNLNDEQERHLLMGLPEMTPAIADAILDWLDDDHVPRWFGAEQAYYRSLESPYRPRNGPLQSLRELLKVRGVTARLLFGDDVNRIGVPDQTNNDGSSMRSNAHSDGLSQRGWATYFTLQSRESNRRADGGKRINLNQDPLTDMYDRLEADLGTSVARFVAAYRLSGPLVPEGADGDAANSGHSDLSGTPSFATRLRRKEGKSTRDGLDLAPEGQFPIESIYELIGVQVRATVHGKQTVLDSPWTSNPANMQQYLPWLMDRLTLTDDTVLLGRVNINQAQREVLVGLPGMTEQLADAIVATQTLNAQRQHFSTESRRMTTGWLVTEGLVDLDQLRQLDPYITAGGDVHALQVIGHFDGGGPVAQMEAMIDATTRPPRIVLLRDVVGSARTDSRQVRQFQTGNF